MQLTSNGPWKGSSGTSDPRSQKGDDNREKPHTHTHIHTHTHTVLVLDRWTQRIRKHNSSSFLSY